MSTTLIFVRHGESEANGNGAFAGHWDIDLTQLGLQQAELTARYIHEHYCVDAVYASDLQRAYHTALPIANISTGNVITTSQLREIFAGEWEGLCFDELQIRYPESYGVWLNDIGKARPTNGESVEQVSIRIWDAVQQILHANQEKTVVIVTHGTPIRTLLCRINGLELAQMNTFSWVSNASVTVVRVEDNRWTLEEIGIDSHLSGFKTQLPANV